MWERTCGRYSQTDGWIRADCVSHKALAALQLGDGSSSIEAAQLLICTCGRDEGAQRIGLAMCPQERTQRTWAEDWKRLERTRSRFVHSFVTIDY